MHPWCCGPSIGRASSRSRKAKGLEGIGLHAGQAVEQSVFELFCENPEIERQVRRAIAGDDVLSEILVRERWFQSWCGPKRDAAGILIGAHGVAYDITQQKHAEQALHANTEFLHAMAETLPAAICIFDPQTITYSYVSRGYERMLGHKPETLLERGPAACAAVGPSRRPADRINAENAAAIAEYEQRPADAPPYLPPKFEYRFRHADGCWRWLLTYGMVFGHKSDGRIGRILNISLDITDRKELEVRLRTMQQELECRVAERTASLEQANQELRAEIAHRKAVEKKLSGTLNHFNLMAGAARVGLWDVEVTPGQPLDGRDLLLPLADHPRHARVSAGRSDQRSGVVVWPDVPRRCRQDAGSDRSPFVPGRSVPGSRIPDVRPPGKPALVLGSRPGDPCDELGQPVRFSGCVIEITDRKQEQERKLQQEEFLRGLLKTNESDRQLMAHDLHDGVLQDLTASVWQLDSLRAPAHQFSDARA